MQSFNLLLILYPGGWWKDGYCDKGEYGIFFNCPAFDCDGGDCSASECMDTNPGELCTLAIEPDYHGTCER